GAAGPRHPDRLSVLRHAPRHAHPSRHPPRPGDLDGRAALSLNRAMADPFAHVQPFQVWDNAFTAEEMDRIVAHGDRLALEKGTVLADGPQVTYDAIRVAQEAHIK